VPLWLMALQFGRFLERSRFSVEAEFPLPFKEGSAFHAQVINLVCSVLMCFPEFGPERRLESCLKIDRLHGGSLPAWLPLIFTTVSSVRSTVGCFIRRPSASLAVHLEIFRHEIVLQRKVCGMACLKAMAGRP